MRIDTDLRHLEPLVLLRISRSVPRPLFRKYFVRGMVPHPIGVEEVYRTSFGSESSARQLPERRESAASLRPAKGERGLQAIDIVEALGIDPADAAHEHWRHIHNRLFVNEKPRP